MNNYIVNIVKKVSVIKSLKVIFNSCERVQSKYNMRKSD